MAEKGAQNDGNEQCRETNSAKYDLGIKIIGQKKRRKEEKIAECLR